MSADLLRRAAAVLRQHAEQATEGPWEVESCDVPNSDEVLWVITAPMGILGDRKVVAETRTRDAGHFSQAEADMSYAALVAPPVAVALAELLETLATMPEVSNRFDLISAESLARAILREERP